MEQDNADNELNNVEVTFTKETNDKIDKLDQIDVNNLDYAKQQEKVNENIEHALVEITDVQKEQQVQNSTVLKAIDNLNVISNKEPDAIKPTADPIVAALNELQAETKADNVNLIKELQNVKIDEKEIDFSPLLAKFDDLASALTVKPIADVTNVENNNVTQGFESFNDNFEKYESQNVSLLEQILTSSNENLTQVKSSQIENNDTRTENSVANEKTLSELTNISQSIEKNEQLHQKSMEQTNLKLESALNQVTLHNENVEKSNVDLNSSITANNVEVKNAIQNNSATNEKLQLKEGGNVVNNNERESQVFQKIENFNVVKENFEKEQSENQKSFEKTNESLQKLQNDVTSINKSSEKITATDATTTNNNTTANAEKSNDELIKSLQEYLSYSVQQQDGILSLLQELVDGQNYSRWSDSPIKN